MKNSKIYSMTLIAVFAALVCIVSPFSIPIGLVPISLSSVVILLSTYIIGYKRSVLSCLIYILLGLVGLPVFASFTSGIGVILGPTGGFIIGYIPLIIISGLFINKFKSKWLHVLGMGLGTIVLYLFGTTWFSVVNEVSFIYSLTICVIPFVLIDIIKIIVVISIGDIIKKRIKVNNYEKDL